MIVHLVGTDSRQYMRVVGTAGHVDHGKSTLVAALSGIHPDRLKEEKAREMTIDLGFAWLTLPGGEDVGIIDVPGHRDFIENMLAGIGGIDAVIFVIAADEGVMPQTREHLAILDLLQIQGGVIALTKIDTVSDQEWLELIESDIRQTVQGTILADAPIFRVSARKRLGLEELLNSLENCLVNRALRPDLGRPRLPVDRVFTLPGFGTVVTGTLSDGQLKVGDELEILPVGLKGRVRGLQNHKRKVEVSVPGSRTAVNISGVDVDQVKRGYVVSLRGKYWGTRRMDVHFRYLPDVKSQLHHNTQVKLFMGSSEVVAKLRLLGKETLDPGNEGWLQLELEQPVVAVQGDRYILRRPSPGETLGGGVVVDPQPIKRHKRFSQSVLNKLESLLEGSAADILYQNLLFADTPPIKDVVTHSRLSIEQAQEALDELIAHNKIVILEPGSISPQADMLVMAQPVLKKITDRMKLEVGNFHRKNPLKHGIGREELKSKLRLSQRLYICLLKQWANNQEITESGNIIRFPDHEIHFSAAQQEQIQNLFNNIKTQPYTPPSVKESQKVVGVDIFNALVESGRLISVSNEVVFRCEDYDKMVEMVKTHFQKEATLTVAQFRDHFQTSRKYALAFLEHLDSVGLTLRDGDVRRFRK